MNSDIKVCCRQYSRSSRAAVRGAGVHDRVRAEDGVPPRRGAHAYVASRASLSTRAPTPTPPSGPGPHSPRTSAVSGCRRRQRARQPTARVASRYAAGRSPWVTWSGRSAYVHCSESRSAGDHHRRPGWGGRRAMDRCQRRLLARVACAHGAKAENNGMSRHRYDTGVVR